MFGALLSFLASQWLFVITVVIYATYKWSTSTFDYFDKKNIKYAKPLPLLGNFKDIAMQKASVFNFIKDIYMRTKNYKFYGVFEFRNPLLYVNDPQVIKQIGIKEFENFLNHRILFDEEDEPLFGHALVSMKDQKWKDMRATLSPAFTGSKMRVMFQLVDECGRNAIKYLKSQSKNGQPVEIDLKDFYTRFTNDVIATCAFGMQINSLLDSENEFYNKSRKATNMRGWIMFKFWLFSMCRRLMKFFKVRLFDKEFVKYFHDLVLGAMQERMTKGIVRPDMINLLIEARKGTLMSQDVGKKDSNEGFAVVEESTVGQKGVNQNWSDEELVAQCFLFFVAGYDTSSTVMCFCAHELMANPDVQRKLILEIDEVREELDGKPLTYEVLQKMKYLDMVVSETLRKWPPVAGTDRVCTRTCTIGDEMGEHLEVNPGDYIMIPIAGLHRDPDLYPEPEKFDPERFSDDNKSQIQPFTYLPFGIGPRNCIGSRFALMEVKAVIFHILSKFTFEASPKTQKDIVLSGKSFQLLPEGGFWLNFKPRQ